MVLRPRAYAINDVVGTVLNGLPVVALGVEIWTRRVVLSLGAVENDVSDAILENYRGQFAEWAVHRDGRPPRQPAEALINELRVELQDEAGTQFSFDGASTGGTGTEWAATRIFTPAPAGGWLSLAFTDSTSRREIRLSIDA